MSSHTCVLLYLWMKISLHQFFPTKNQSNNEFKLFSLLYIIILRVKCFCILHISQRKCAEYAFIVGKCTRPVRQQKMGWICNCSMTVLGIYLLLYASYSVCFHSQIITLTVAGSLLYLPAFGFLLFTQLTRNDIPTPSLECYRCFFFS